MVRACRSMPQEHWCGVVSHRLRSPPLLKGGCPMPAVPRRSAEEGASIRIIALQLTAYSLRCAAASGSS